MKPISILFLFLLFLTSCHREVNKICTISGKANQYDAKELYLIANGQKDTLRIGEEGTFSVDVACAKPADAVIQGESVQLKIYLEPGGNLEIAFNGQGDDKSLEFAGDLALPAQYLLEKDLQNRKSQKMRLACYRPPKTAGDFKYIRDSLAQSQYAFLETFKKAHPELSDTFYKREKLAISYSLYADLYGYPRRVNVINRERMKIPSNWYAFMEDIKMDDPAILDISEGEWFVTYYVALESAKRAGISYEEISWNSDWIRETFDFVGDHFTHQRFYNQIGHYFLNLYMEDDRMGTAGIEDLVVEYLSKSTDETLKKDIQRLCNKWAPIAKGQPAPNFKLFDIDGDTVSLKDFRGKYVFVDFWFAGCGSCKAMFPYLKLIMNEYKQRNIVFISISVDKEQSDWEQMLKEGYNQEGIQVLFEEKPNWIHLWDPQSRAVAKQYLITGYPTYILIDRDGNYMRYRCERPNRMDKIRKLLEAQPGL
jgi:peroxiredoxin